MFLVPEGEWDSYNSVYVDVVGDLNEDSDFDDQVLHRLDAAGSVTNLHLAVRDGGQRLPLTTGGLIFAVSEFKQGESDLNGDGDSIDNVLHRMDALGNVTNLSLSGHAYEMSGSRIAVNVSELDQGNTDRNGDGDTEDYVLHWVGSTGEVRNLSLAASAVPLQVPAAEELLFLVNEMIQREDLNDNFLIGGESVVFKLDASGNVTNLHRTAHEGRVVSLSPGSYLYSAAERTAYGGGFTSIDLNGDGDDEDAVWHLVDFAASVRNLQLADTGPAARLSDGGFILSISETERHLDLNADGDTEDLVLHQGQPTGQVANLGIPIKDSGTEIVGLPGGGFVFSSTPWDPDGRYIAHVGPDGIFRSTRGVFPDRFSDVTDIISSNGYAFSIDESYNSTDLNDDGDVEDWILQFSDISGNVSNLGFSGSVALSDGGGIASVPEWENGGDLNGDGDSSDAVLHRFWIGGRVLAAVSGITSKDRDGDGIPNLWETDGVTMFPGEGFPLLFPLRFGPRAESGRVEGGTFVDLRRMGADPDVRDVFVHVDWFARDRPDWLNPAFLRPMIEQFLFQGRATGRPIRLHIDAGSDSTMDPETGESWGALSRAGTMMSVSRNPGDAGFWAAKAARFEPAGRDGIFHYVCACIDPNSDLTSRGIAGKGHVVGPWILLHNQAFYSVKTGTFFSGPEMVRTFMHELGHNLGLQHGGLDRVEAKPNHQSVMNYLYMRGGPRDSTGQVPNPQMNYSHEELGDLNEYYLLEPDGLNRAGYGFKWQCSLLPGLLHVESAEAANSQSKPEADWDCLSGIRRDGPVEVDIDGNGKLATLKSFDEWQYIADYGALHGVRNFTGLMSWENAEPLDMPPSTEPDPDEVGNDFFTEEEIAATVTMPVAGVSLNRGVGTAPAPVAFDASASSDPDGAIAVYEWDFGDGTTSAEGPTVTHTYTVPGEYTAALTIIDDVGSRSEAVSASVTIRAENSPPTATAAAAPHTGPAPLATTFSASDSTDPDGTLRSFRWDFGDGTTGDGETTTHIYADPGAYDATLTVTDDDGASATTTTTIEAVSTTGDRFQARFNGAITATIDEAVERGDLTVAPGGTELARTVAGSATLTGNDGAVGAHVALYITDLWRRSDGTCRVPFLTPCPAPFYGGWISITDPTQNLHARVPVVGPYAVRRIDSATVTGTARWIDARRFPWRAFAVNWTILDAG